MLPMQAVSTSKNIHDADDISRGGKPGYPQFNRPSLHLILNTVRDKQNSIFVSFRRLTERKTKKIKQDKKE